MPLKSRVTVLLTKCALLGKDDDLSKHNQHLYYIINAVSTSNEFLTRFKNP